jgi:hypothetical protein
MPESNKRRAVATVDVVTTSHAWETLRDTHGLDSAEAVDCVVDAIMLQLEHVA